MDGFMGTSIQHSEQEILRLEREHAEQMERTASELIQSGFLDTDYEDSETESTLTEYSDSRSIEMHEPPVAVDDESASEDTSSPTAIIGREPETESETAVEPERADSISTVQRSVSTHDDAPATASESESDTDVDAEEEPAMPDLETMVKRLRMILIVKQTSLKSLMETIVSDIRGIAMLLLLIVVLQMANERTDDTLDHDDRVIKACPRLIRNTQIHAYWQPRATLLSSSRRTSDDDEDGDDDDEKECAVRRTLNFDVVTTTFDRHTNTVYQSKSIGHAIHAIRFNDLFCDDDDDVAGNGNHASNSRSPMAAPRQIPRLLLQFGAGLKSTSPQVMRIFKETVADTGRHLVRNHGLTALVMSFAGIAAVTAASSGLDELL